MTHIMGHYEPGDPPWRIVHIGTIEVSTDGGLDLDGWAFADPRPHGRDHVEHGEFTSPDPLFGHSVAELHALGHGQDCICPVAKWKPRGRAEAAPARSTSPDPVADRIRDAIWAAWCGSGKPRVDVTLIRQQQGASIYQAAMPLGILTIPVAGTDGSDLGLAAQMLVAHLGTEAWITGAAVVFAGSQPDHALVMLRVGGTSQPDPMLGQLGQAIPHAWGGELESLQQVIPGRRGLYRAMVTGQVSAARDSTAAGDQLAAAVGGPAAVRHMLTGHDGLIAVIEASGTPAPAQTGASAPAPTGNGDQRMATEAQAAQGDRMRMAPAAWALLIAHTADFEAHDDAELVTWMSDQVVGMVDFGEMMAELQKRHVQVTGLDPRAMELIADVAEIIATASEKMTGAIDRFKQTYEPVTEFVGSGGQMPHDGRFFTGEVH